MTQTLDTTEPTSTAATTAAAGGPTLSARDLVKVYGRGQAEVRALDGASIDIAAGTFTAIMGPSGSGKSTLLHVLAGLDDPDSGQVLLGATDLTTLSERKRTLLRRDRFGFVFQAFNLIPALSAAENIALPLTLAGRRPDPDHLTRLVETLGLADRLTHRPAELSGGQQQRVAVARALVTRPDVVFADEPTGNLDSRHGTALLEFLRQASTDLGQTIVMVTHDPNAASYADAVCFLADGKAVDTLTHPNAAEVSARMVTLDERKAR
jgi:putative ABC transport system ATP-binding protein